MGREGGEGEEEREYTMHHMYVRYTEWLITVDRLCLWLPLHLSLRLPEQPHSVGTVGGVKCDYQRRVFKGCHHLHVGLVQVVHTGGVVCVGKQTHRTCYWTR